MVAAAGWVLGTQTGTAWALQLGVAQYAGLIPGDARLGAVYGNLLDGPELRDLVLLDRAGVERVRVGQLRLDWTPLAVFDGQVPLAVSVRGVRVALGPGGDASALRDLAPPPSDEPPPPPRQGPLTIPMTVEAWLRVHDVQLTVPDGPPMATLQALVLRADAQGTRLGVGLHTLQAQAQGHAVRGLRLGATWDGVEATVEGLWLDSDLGRIRGPRLRVAPGDYAGRLALDVRADRAALAPILRAQGLAPLPADPTVRLSGGGGPKGFSLSLAARMGEALDLAVRLDGALTPAPRLEVAVDLAGVDPDALGVAVTGDFQGGLYARVEAPPTPLDQLAALRPEALTATVTARCEACRLPPVGRFSVQADATLRAGAGRAAVWAEALGITARLAAQVDDALQAQRSGLAAQWQVDAPSVARAARVAKVAAQGRVSTQGECAGDLEGLVCRGQVEGAGLAAQGARADRVSVGFEVAPLAAAPAFDATARVAGVRAPGVPHPVSGTVTAVGTPARVALTVAARHGPDRLATALTVAPGPPLTVELHRLRARAQGVALRSTRQAQVTLEGGAVRIRGLRLAMLGGQVRVDGRFDAARGSDLRIATVGLELAALRRFVPKPALAGALDLSLRLTGPLRAATVAAEVGLQGLAVDGAPVGDLAVQAELTPRRASAQITLADGAARRVALSAAVPVRADLAAGRVTPVLTQAGHVDLTLVGVTHHWLGPVAKLPDGVAFSLDGTLRAQGQAGAWGATAQLGGEAGAGPLKPAPFTLGLEVGPTAQRVVLDAQITPPVAEAQPVPVHLSAQTTLALEPLLRGGKPDLDAPLDARLTVPPVPLAPLSALLPSSLYDLQGQLAVDVRAKGPLREPGLFGGLTLSDGALTVLPIGQRLSGLAAQLMLEGRTLTLDGLDFKAAGGKGRLTAAATLGPDNAVTATAGLHLHDFPVLAPGAPPLRVRTRISVQAARPAAGTPTVEVRLKGTDVELVELAGGGPRPIPSHPNITYVDAAGRAQAAAAAEAAPAGPASPLDLTVDLSDPVRIHGRILDMAWGGRLRVRTGPDPLLEGALKAQGGFVELLSNRFELADGQITLAQASGPMPFLRIEAKTETPEAVVTARIRGSAANPKLEFGAEPALEESEILTLLVTGSTTPSEEDKQTVGEQAGALFATFSSPRFERALQDKLGVDRVRLTFGEGGLETPVLSFGKHITRRLYVEARYRPNPTETENESELSARLKLKQRWTLESRYGDLGLGDLGLYWEVPLR